MSSSFPLTIEIGGIADVDPLDGSTPIWIRRLDKKIIINSHQAVGMNPD
ncbi:hypothetical protein LCGC14_1375140 [marine sediment metagenome]|uniref:Uncharacterized protein n=1 Tax=marine sediment metagenome TaxID=412755 RepID=A0A0F9N691_9ZZZZ